MKSPLNSIHALAATLITFGSLAGGADAATAVTNFTDFSNGRFINVIGSTAVSAVSIDGVTITPSRFSVRGAYGNPGLPSGGANNPGDQAGYISSNFIPDSSLDSPTMTLNLSESVFGFGVTFTHFESRLSSSVGLDLPARLRVYDGPDGTGNLLGSVLSSGLIPSDGRTADFVGIFTDSSSIQSAVLDGTGALSVFGVDGYGITTSVPEPSSALLLGLGILGLSASRRRQR